MQGDGNINYHFTKLYLAPKCGKLKSEHGIGPVKYFIIILLLNLTD